MKLRGYPIVCMVLAIVAVWALKVAYLCTVRDAGPDRSRLTQRDERLRLALERLPVNILERFCDELGLRTERLDPTGTVAWPDLETVFVLGGEGQADEAFWRRAFTYAARTGARIVHVTPATRGGPPDLSPLDIEFGPLTRHEVELAPVHGLPLLQPVAVVAPGRAYPVRSLATSALRLLADETGSVFGVLRTAGHGEIVVLGTPYIADLDVLDRADNGLLLASLALRHDHDLPPHDGGRRGDRRLNRHAPVGFVFVDTKARELMHTTMNDLRQTWLNEDRNRPLLTLWSIVRANPETIVLVQMLLACSLYLLGRRELTAAEPTVEPAPADSFLQGFEGLCRRVPCERLLLPGCTRYFRTNLATRLGLPPEADAAAVTGRLGRVSAAHAKEYAKLNDELAELARQDREVTSQEFVMLMRRMDRVLAGVAR